MVCKKHGGKKKTVYTCKICDNCILPEQMFSVVLYPPNSVLTWDAMNNLIFHGLINVLRNFEKRKEEDLNYLKNQGHFCELPYSERLLHKWAPPLQ